MRSGGDRMGDRTRALFSAAGGGGSQSRTGGLACGRQALGNGERCFEANFEFECGLAIGFDKCNSGN